MKLRQLSVKSLCLLVGIGETCSMLAVTMLLYRFYEKNTAILLGGAVLTVCALFWLCLLIVLFRKRLTVFADALCATLDGMMSGNRKPQKMHNRELLFDRISHQLLRLYDMMQAAKYRVDEERCVLQMLVTDISHQIKTPLSNLKMVTDTLLSKPVTEAERWEFLQGIRSQTEKLEFLFQSLVKSSRLETGMMTLKKQNGLLFDTLAQAVSGIVYDAEQKEIAVSVDCPQDLYLCHDRKWTAEALFNLLDNAVKYTPAGGRISVSVERWELYVKVDVADTGKGIAECSQASVFGRFYREEDVHDEQGVGIGLYLAREIITKQGGYIKVVSKVGEGSTFSVFLPFR